MECRRPEDSCQPGKGRYKSIRQMVDEYITCKTPHKRKERECFERLSLEKAVGTAALAKNCEGKRSSHHCRRTPAQLALGKAKLIALLPKIRRCESFDELHDIVCRVTDEVKGLGELYAYDTAYLVGIRLGLWPKRVFLHAGTRKGAQALGFSAALSHLEPSRLPRQLRRLKPCEIEDFLCIYEAALRRLHSKSPRT